MKNSELSGELRRNLDRQQAFLAFNYYNAETLKGILLAANQFGTPVILQASRSSIEYLGLDLALRIGREALSQYQVKGWIQLDHGDSVELVRRCLDAGFDSVMIDASEQPIAENIRITAEVVKLAERYHASVEAELGYIAKLGQSTERIGFTEPGEAKMFYESTGIDALAVAIGTIHGFYKEEPRLDLDRLLKIHSEVPVPLVLHGASGIPANLLRESVQRGICKINIATEVKNIFVRTLRQSLHESNEIDLRKVFGPAVDAVRDLVLGKMNEIL